MVKPSNKKKTVKKPVKKTAKKTVKAKSVKKPAKKTTTKRKTTVKKRSVKNIIKGKTKPSKVKIIAPSRKTKASKSKTTSSRKTKKLKPEELKEVINILKAKNDVRGFVTFGEILNLVPHPELNVKNLDDIFNTLFGDNVTVTKNLDVLEIDKELSIENLVKSTSLEE
ncbi:MAG: hypothetical protein PHP14_02945 [Candidatus Pacebacteria bacterium]|nr:hypothetical protein [Candidatus Paceibacterota bacterium]